MPRPEPEEGQCESCLIFIDGVEEQRLEEYRGHEICPHCRKVWWEREKMAGREITWDELKKGKLKRKGVS